jgi:hypothetical protein
MAALASGNPDHLAQAREAFLKHSHSSISKQVPPAKSSSEPQAPASKRMVDAQPPIEHRPAPRNAEHPFLPVDQLQREEEELSRVEAQLERRRAEVAFAMRNAEEEAKRRAFEESRRQIELEARRRAESSNAPSALETYASTRS